MNLRMKLVIVFFMILISFKIIKTGVNETIITLLFSNESYAKEIEVKARIISEDQACSAFSDLPNFPAQLSSGELYKKNTYLFLQVRNLGNSHAWGTLACKVPGYHVPIMVPIFGLDKSENYHTYIIYLGKIVFTPEEPGYPTVSLEWDELYTK